MINIQETKALQAFCKECVIAQELLDKQAAISQKYFDMDEYVILMYVK